MSTKKRKESEDLKKKRDALRVLRMAIIDHTENGAPWVEVETAQSMAVAMGVRQDLVEKVVADEMCRLQDSLDF